jgi:hypothetical protein
MTKANSRAWNGHPAFSRTRKMRLIAFTVLGFLLDADLLAVDQHVDVV